MQNKSNHSHFIRTLSKGFKVDLEQLWQDSMQHKDPYSGKRAVNDRVETRFWSRFSNQYDQVPSLYDYAPHVLDRILVHTGKNKTMTEIGCGTGKFTQPMLKVARHIHAIDFSPHMLAKFSAKLSPEERKKVTLIRAKWEDHPPEKVDCLYSVNAIYRMTQIRSALTKMNTAARHKVVIVWTMQRSIFDSFINRFHKKGLERNQEYIHLLALLYEMNIDPGLEFIKTTKPIVMEKKRAFEMLNLLLQRHSLPSQEIMTAFKKEVTLYQDKIFFPCPLKVALIHWVPA